jgi:1-hydroxycarotenoid 3,4-desaturase
VVFNGDVAALRAGLLGAGAQPAAPREPGSRSLSALTWSVLAPTRGHALDRHNVFFQKDYASEFKDIFLDARLPRQPTVYVCAQDRGAGQPVPDGAERLLCLVNAPATGDNHPLSEHEIDTCEQASLALMARCGLHLRLEPDNHVRTDPRAFHQRFPATGGALYGQATHGWMSAFARSGAATPIQGLFLAGGSVHPGPGVPMAAMSGVQAAAALMASPALTRRSPQVATSGGMSMH